jgi:hypothetical protein
MDVRANNLSESAWSAAAANPEKGDPPMFGLFKKTSDGGNQAPKLSGPKEVPDEVGRSLVVDLKQDPTWAWSLKAVIKPDGGNRSFFVRVYEERQAYSKGVQVRNFSTLDDHPELILFDGWFSKKTHEARLEARKKAA